MELLTDIIVRKTRHSRVQEVDFDTMEFGQHVSDHMLISDYENGEWNAAQIVPFANLSVSPATLALHYGQTVFEGMKAFRMQDGKISIFRMERHYERFVRSLERMCMAIPPREMFTEGLQKLIALDEAWVPRKSGTSLYLRPFMYASEAKMGVKVSDTYRFLIITGPVPELYARPVRVKVETEYVRAAKGGTGYAKCGGNYGGAFYPLQQAKKQGYDQVLWTTGGDNATIEESGTMNVMFVIEDTLFTPPLSDSILDGVTRDSLLVLANDLGYKTAERPVSVNELEKAFRNKTITEAFGAGTAAVVAPIATIQINGVDYHLPSYTNDALHNKIKAKLERIRTGREEDVYGWNTVVSH
ncbi:MAG TPA: branched-chain amino acid aminotransferase [Chitinophagaceae bacterium]|jgi:branched-chain amino acid aminotransferase|nr:branched-chain amino acid aminotransferase [Chitinophagaceae bacterium]